jgi:hypothetical protein
MRIKNEKRNKRVFYTLFFILICYQGIIYFIRSSLGENVYSFLLILGIVAIVLLHRAFESLEDAERS